MAVKKKRKQRRTRDKLVRVAVGRSVWMLVYPEAILTLSQW